MSSVGLALLLAAAALSAAPADADKDRLEAARQALRADRLLVDRTPDGAARAIALDLHLGKPGAADALRRWAESAEGTSESRAAAWHLLCEDRFRRSEFGAALAACAEGDRIAGKATTQSLQKLLASVKDVGPPRWEKPALKVPLIRDSDGTRRVLIGAGDDATEAIVDTGAELSLMVESVAKRFNARAAGGTTLGTSTNDANVGIAVVDRLAVGDNVLRNLVVSVVPDAQLTFPDGTSIPAILGLPALLAAGKFGFLGHGSMLVMGSATPKVESPAATALYWDPSGIGFAAGFAKAIRPVHFDSGSKRNELFPAGLSAISDQERAGLRRQDRQVTGLGGTRTEQASMLPSVTMAIGTQPWRVAPLEVAEKDESGEAARIGAPLFDSFRDVIFDTQTMRMIVTP